MAMRFQIKNIRTRLAVWYAAILGLILVATAFAVVSVFSHGLTEEFDRNLNEHFERADRHLERGAAGEFSLRKPERTGKNPQRDFAEEMPVEILNESGMILYQSPAWKRAGLESEKSSALKVERVVYSMKHAGEHHRVMQGLSHFEDTKVWVRVALSEGRIWHEIWELITVFLVLFPLGMGAAGLAGYWMAKKALSPVDQISRQTGAISAESLKARLRVSNPDDELGVLARVINHLLERLEKSFEELRRFTSDASHELRTPLQALRSTGEVALQKNESTAYYREVISSMLEETERMSRLTESLLTLSRGDAGNYKLQKTQTSLAVIVEEVRNLISVLAEEKKQKLLLELQSIDNVNVDPIIFRQAVVNLIDNAIKYSSVGSEIKVKVSTLQGEGMIEIKDQGAGIAKDDQNKIFDRFYRIDKSRSRELGGSGLGLSIAKWAVEVHGGRIELESQPGAGSSFRIHVPLA